MSPTVILHKKPKPSSIRIIIQSEQTIKWLTILATNSVLNGSVVAFATECGSPETEQEQMIIHTPYVPCKQILCQHGAYIERFLVLTCMPLVRPSRVDDALIVLLGFQFLLEEACLQGPVE